MVASLRSAALACAMLLCGLGFGAWKLQAAGLGASGGATDVLPLSLVGTSGQAVPITPGRATVIEIFATWCEFSAYEARYVVPQFSAYVRTHHGVMVGVDETNRLGIGQSGPFDIPADGSDGQDDPAVPHTQAAFVATLQAYAREFGLTMPLLYDPHGILAQRLTFYLGPGFAYPTFVFLGPDGRFRTRAEGVQSLDTLEATYSQAYALP